MSSVEDQVRAIIAEQLGVKADEIENDASFVDDLERIRWIPSSWSWL